MPEDAAPLSIDYVPWDDVKPHPENARRHDIAKIRRSIRDRGQYAPILVQRSTGYIVKGNGTHEALGLEQVATVAVIFHDYDDDEALEVLAMDNAASDSAGYHHDRLVPILERLAARDALDSAGWDRAAVDRVLADQAEATKQTRGRKSTAIPEAPGEPVTQRGDLWTLGPHRLVCGDSFDEDTVAFLTEDRPADLVLTDPPYAIYGSASGISSEVTDDKMVRPFFSGAWRMIARHLKVFGHAYMHCDWRSWSAIWEGARSSGMAPRNMLVWDKGGSGLGSSYANTHELVAFFARIPTSTTMTSNTQRGHRDVFRSNVLRYDRPTGTERQHNAAKPVPLLEDLINNSTERGERVLDLFSGSGSVLIACELTGRRALAMEYEPKWVDVIVARWERVTGGKAKRHEGAVTLARSEPTPEPSATSTAPTS